VTSNVASRVFQVLGSVVASPRTRNQYTSCLAYWSAWHQLRYGGAELSLLRNPASAIEAQVLRDFAIDHSPVLNHDPPIAEMDPGLAATLHRMGFRRRRLCPKLATCRWHLRAVCGIQAALGLIVVREDIDVALSIVESRWALQNAVFPQPRRSETVASLVHRLRSACPESRDGARRAAMVDLLTLLTTSQLAKLTFGDLVPSYADLGNGRTVRIVDVYIRNPINSYQRIFRKHRLVDNDAAAISMWGAIRVYDELGEDGDRAPPNLPFLVRDVRGGGCAKVSDAWVRQQLRIAVLDSGVAAGPFDEGFFASTLRLQAQRESQNQRVLLRIAHRANLRRVVSAKGILRNIHAAGNSQAGNASGGQ
jgi:hypothetical protein